MPATPPPPERPLRADAERNRALIVAAARALFAERGLGITLDAVAERAGVGVATVYRRFPDKNALIDGVFTDGIAALTSQARQALAAADPWAGLVGLCEYACTRMSVDRGLTQVMLARADGAHLVEPATQAMRAAVAQVVARARDAGLLRPEAQVADLLAVLHMVAFFGDFADPVAPGAWRRYLQVCLDGLRGPARPDRQPLTVPPLTDAQADAARRAHAARKR